MFMHLLSVHETEFHESRDNISIDVVSPVPFMDRFKYDREVMKRWNGRMDEQMDRWEDAHRDGSRIDVGNMDEGRKDG